MSQTVIKCPHCNKNLGNYDTNDYLYGSPLKFCPHCKNTYFDIRYHEIAVEGIREIDVSTDKAVLGKKRRSGILTILGGIGVMVLFIVMILLGWIFYFFPVISIGLIIAGVKTLLSTNSGSIAKTRQKLEIETQQSNLRMQNPQYVEQLRMYGYLRTVAPVVPVAPGAPTNPNNQYYQ